MLELHMSVNRDALRTNMIGAIKHIDETREGLRIFVLVPEQATFVMNRDVCKRVGYSSKNRIEVIGFERLMRLVYKDLGKPKDHMDEGGRLIAMSQAATASKKGLRVFGQSVSRPEFYKTLLGTYESMKFNGIPLDAMILGAEAKESVPKSVQAKLSDIHDIFAKYEEICAETLNDPADELSSVATMIKECDWANGSVWFIDGFSDFPKQQKDIIFALIQSALSVRINLVAEGVLDTHPGRAMAVATAIYFNDKLKRKCSIVEHTAPDTDTCDALRYMHANLCDTAPVKEFAGESSESSKAIGLYCDVSAYQECQHIAGDILKAIRAGRRYRDISVVLCDYDRYAPIMDTVCRRYGIPAYFSSDKVEIAKNPVMASVFSAMDAATRGMPLESVLQYIKSGVNNLTMDEADVLETYARTWNIHGRGWAPDGGWMMNPSGYGKDMTEADTAALEQINGIREKGITPLLKLRESMNGTKAVGEFVLALNEFLTDIGFADSVQRIVDDLSNTGDRQTAMQFAQVNDVITHAMEQMYDTLNKTERTAQDFVKLFKLICSAYKIATIPATLDQVDITSVPDARFVCSKIRFFVGCEEGVFPTYAAAAGLFDSYEIDELSKVGINMPGGVTDTTIRSLSEVNMALLGAKQRVVLSYASDPAAPATPSHLFVRAKQMFPNIQVERGCGDDHIYAADLMNADMAGRLAGRISNRKEYDEILGSLIVVDDRSMQETASRICTKAAWKLGNLSRESVKGLYGERIPLSATRTDVYSACRYRFFLQYGLGMKEPATGKSDAPAFGRFAHFVLEKAIQEIETEYGGFAMVTESQMRDITKKYIDQYTAEKMKGLETQPERYAYLYKRNCREIIQIMANYYKELRDARFRCSKFELRIGGESPDVPGVKVKGKEFSGMYTGIADRVDICEVHGHPYVRVVDYKTGKTKDMDPSDLLCGMSMQILMEQAALREVGFTPKDGQAGVLYVPAKDPVIALPTKPSDDKVISEYEKMTSRHGILLDDKEVLDAMEPVAPGKAKYIPVKYAADGSIDGDVCSAEQMSQLNEFTKRMMEQVVDGIGSGDVSANPISRGPERNACSYCPMKASCHKDACGTMFRYRKQVDKSEFWSAVRKIVKK